MRPTLLALVAITGCAAIAPVAAQNYPARPVRVINPFAPGGGLDIVLRPTLQKVGDSLKQSFVVDNRPGAAGVIGTDIGAKSAPDGYTLIGATTGTITINPSTYAKLPFDPLRDLAPITSIGSASFILVVHPSVPARNARELVALAKRNPNELTMGSPGYGGINHVGGEYFSQMAGVRFTHVPFKGSGPMLVDITGGHVMLAFDSMQATLPHIRAGKLRALGLAAEKRSPVAPEIPTVAESGGPAMSLASWYGILAPTGTPREIVVKLQAEVVKALALPDLRERFAGLGIEPVGNTPDQFAAEIKEDITRWAKVVRAANIRAE